MISTDQQGIPPHIDTHSCCDGQISSLSLGSDTVMVFSGESRGGSTLSGSLTEESQFAYFCASRRVLLCAAAAEVAPRHVGAGEVRPQALHRHQVRR